MCALAPFPTPAWPLVNPIGYEMNHMIYGGIENTSIDQSIFLQQAYNYQSPSFTTTTTTQSSGDPSMVKKLNHNASERDRRKKVNSLYSSLRSLLPEADQMKKLSFPATVAHALKYIPELQGEVERLVQKKEKLLLRISQRRGGVKRELDQQQRKSRGGRCSSTAISINQLSESEVVIHISMHRVDHQKNQLLSEILQCLEQDGIFLLLNASSFESFGGLIFYTIHLQMETSYKLESEALSEKLWSLFDNRVEFLI